MGGNNYFPYSEKMIYSRQYGYYELKQQIQKYKVKEAIKIYELTSQDEQKSFENLIRMHKYFNVPTILPIYSSQSINDENGIKYGWRLKFKYLQKNLDEEIKEKKKLNSKYNQDQILKTLDCVLSALIGFHLKKLFHGNVNCENILIDYHPNSQEVEEIGNQNDQDNKIYVIGLPLLLNNQDICINLKNKQYQKHYLSPLGLSQLMEGRLKPSTSQKSDVFALGIVMLKMASFCQIQDIYDYQKMKIKKQIIQKIILNQCQQIYTKQFCNMIQKMLESSQRLRLDLEGVLNCLSTLSNQNQKKIQDQQTNSNQKYFVTQKKSNGDLTFGNKFLPSKENTQLTINDSKNKYHNIQTEQSGRKSVSTRLFSNTTSKKKKGNYGQHNSLFLQDVFISKDNQKAWNKFCQRMKNKQKNTCRKEFSGVV